MTKKELQKIATKLMMLEQECQKGNNISENLTKMEELIKHLTVKEMLELDMYMEENFNEIPLEKYLTI